MYTCMQGDNSTCISSGRQVPCQAHNACCISGGEAVGGGAWSVACYCNYKAHSHLLNAGKLSAWLTFLSPIQQVDSQYFSVKHPDTKQTPAIFLVSFQPTLCIAMSLPSITTASLSYLRKACPYITIWWIFVPSLPSAAHSLIRLFFV